MKRMLFAVNPKAGKSEIKNHLMDIIDIFVKADWRVEVRTTQHASHVTELFRDEAQNYDLVVCAGGDGTLNEAVSGLCAAQQTTPLGYLPAGTTNDFAASIDLPRNALKAAEAIVNGTPVTYDAGLLNGRCFVYVAAFGAFTRVSYDTPQEIKNALGRAAYILEGIRSLAELKGYSMRVVCDGEEEISGEFIYGMVSNSTSVGGFKMSEKGHVDMDDGLLELLLVRNPHNLIDLQEAITALLANDWQSPHLICRQVKNVKIYAEEEIAWTCDGEFGGAAKDSEISVLPQAYRIQA